MKRQRVDPGWSWTKKFNFWVGWKLGETVQLSGLVAFDSEGGVVGKDDFYAQSIQTFKNIEEALESGGAKITDVVKITTYLTDMSGKQHGRLASAHHAGPLGRNRSDGDHR